MFTELEEMQIAQFNRLLTNLNISFAPEEINYLNEPYLVIDEGIVLRYMAENTIRVDGQAPRGLVFDHGRNIECIMVSGRTEADISSRLWAAIERIREMRKHVVAPIPTTPYSPWEKQAKWLAALAGRAQISPETLDAEDLLVLNFIRYLQHQEERLAAIEDKLNDLEEKHASYDY